MNKISRRGFIERFREFLAQSLFNCDREDVCHRDRIQKLLCVATHYRALAFRLFVSDESSPSVVLHGPSCLYRDPGNENSLEINVSTLIVPRPDQITGFNIRLKILHLLSFIQLYTCVARLISFSIVLFPFASIILPPRNL